MQPFEKLGAFYLGKEFDPKAGEPTEDILLYDAKDLTTHAVCVGMTGSGKTGLCVSLLEEAALDGIPTLAIDPKGDLGNLLLNFPGLTPAEFKPWIDPGEAARKGATVDEYAANRAGLWKKGLGSWGQDGARIQALRDAVDMEIYTPGSSAGIELSVLRSFAAPPQAVIQDGDLLRERVGSAVSGLLALLGIDADPIQSREHILLSNILQTSWMAGEDLDLAGLIREIQAPPFARIGVMELDSFYPPKERFSLAMRLNNLLASPGFASWMRGRPLDIPSMLWTPEGKPRIAIVSIAHLNDAERMFIVTLLLNEMLSWIRTQPGTSSLRALLYMDEVFGYFPPTANPPSKTPMLTLLKQARAFGLGCVLATQNPVDLDYKGLSNTGTWFLGRLQTERDKARVLDGLEGASTSNGISFDRGKLEALLSGLQSRVFLMNNVHDDGPTLFHTRWAMSYLRGPLTRTQIQTLMAEKKGQAAAAAPARPVAAPASASEVAAAAAPAPAAGESPAERPLLPPGIEERFVPRVGAIRDGERLLYRPSLLAATRLHFTKARTELDHWNEETLLVTLDADAGADPWEDATPVGVSFSDLETEPEGAAAFGDLPSRATKAKSYTSWQKTLKSSLYRTRTWSLWACKDPKATSAPDETQSAFRSRLSQLQREDRDVAVAKLEKKYSPKLARVQERIRKAQMKIEKEKAQFSQRRMESAVSIGTTVLGALFGRRSSAVGKAGTSARTMGRAAKEHGDVRHAQEDLVAQQAKLAELETDFQDALADVRDTADPTMLEVAEVPVRPRKADISVERLVLAWTPWKVTKDGIAEPAFDTGGE